MKLGKLVGQGRTAEIFEISDNKVLKLFRTSFPKDFTEHELHIVTQLLNLGLPIPNVDELITVNNRQGIVYEKITGKTMMQVLAANPFKLKREAKRLAELHQSIQVKIESEFPSQKFKLRKNILKTNSLEENLKDALLKNIDLLPDEKILCHGDFHPDNIMISKDKLWVIDWTNASVGDRFSDIARTRMLLKYAVLPENEPRIKRTLVNKIRLKFYHEYLSQYLQLVGGESKNVDIWETPTAAARLIEWIPQKEKDLLVEIIKNHFAE